MINFVLQGKGGVGKSLSCSFLAQYLLSKKKKKIICIDTDPVNSTFSGYTTLGVEVIHINILDGNKVNTREFDKLMELIMNSPDADFVIDNGATSFIPLSSYLYDNDALSLLKSMGHNVAIHTVITGGQALLDTLSGLSSLASQFDYSEGTNLVVWANEYFGLIESQGKSLEDMAAYKDNKSKISGIIYIPQQNELFQQDIQQMLETKLTFDDVKKSKDFSFMAKNRINIFNAEIFKEIGPVYKKLTIAKQEK